MTGACDFCKTHDSLISKKDPAERRPEILALFQKEVYGRSPEPPANVVAKVLETSDHALDGKAIRKQVRLQLSRGERQVAIDILIYLPAKAQGPVPTFLTLNFFGNHTVHKDPAIILSKSWMIVVRLSFFTFRQVTT